MKAILVNCISNVISVNALRHILRFPSIKSLSGDGTKHVSLKIELCLYGIIIKSCVVYMLIFSFNFVVFVVVVVFILVVFFLFFPSVNQ